jgi:hypothetical protein
MFIIHGIYRFAPRLVGYRNDWCNHCERPVLAQQWRSFYVGHAFWIPIVPLGFYKAWRCKECDKDPRKRVRTAVGFIVAGLVASSAIFALMLLAPYSGEDAAMFWGMRAVFGIIAVFFAWWLKTRLDELPAAKNVEPLRNDRCLVCDGRMTDHPRWHCVECGVARFGD